MGGDLCGIEPNALRRRLELTDRLGRLYQAPTESRPDVQHYVAPRGEPVAPIWVIQKRPWTGRYVLVNGHHRLAAHRLVHGNRSIEAVVISSERAL